MASFTEASSWQFTCRNESIAEERVLRREILRGDLVVVGGGMAGVCCAITAARQGLRVLLVQDRSVLGGNASSEVRLWILGATSHMGNNNRWAREGGVIDEILVENLWRNPEGNPVLVDTLLLEWVSREPNITLLLNTAVHSINKSVEGCIHIAFGYCSQNETNYELTAPLFCDASGDGILAFLAGAPFRMGAEAASEFGEGLGGDEPIRELLGHSLYFYSRDTGKPIDFIAPSFALDDITRIPRYRELRVTDSGCRLWWLEYGGDMDTVHHAEEIKWELWKIAYGVWNYIKNSGKFSEAKTLALEWMGMIPGKRESRRFEGDYILTQRDIVEQKTHYDAVSYGGWAIDLHPARGVYSAAPGCVQLHSKGVYQIPFRTMYSRTVPNLFLAGRIISTSHIAFGSTRVMATCAHNAQAVGMAATLCIEEQIFPRQVFEDGRGEKFQQRLLRAGQYIPGVRSNDSCDLARRAQVTASSSLLLSALDPSGETCDLNTACALLLPIAAGTLPKLLLQFDVADPVDMEMEAWGVSRAGNYTPDIKIASTCIHLGLGSKVPAEFCMDAKIERDSYIFFILKPQRGVSLYLSKAQRPGVLTLWQKMNQAVAKSAVQSPPAGSGIDTFAFWLPDRRPEARNIAVELQPPLRCYEPQMVLNGWTRPWCGANAWAPAQNDPSPSLQLTWSAAQTVRSIEITFDTDFDHPMESVLLGHPERTMPGCVTAFEVRTAEGEVLATVPENHQTRWRLKLPRPVTTTGLEIAIHDSGPAPAIFEVRCY